MSNYVKVMYKEKSCAHCENLFVPNRKDKIYCSRRCKERNKKVPYTKYKDTKCAYCNFIPLHECQLDVDHIDGNHKNNSIDNLQTLCANCHRLKTYTNKDWE